MIWLYRTTKQVGSVLVEAVKTLTSSCFRGFSEKKPPKRTWLCVEVSPVRYALQTREKSQKTRQVFSSALEKKNFCLGVAGFLWGHHKWRTFRPPWPTLPGPGRQPLGGSILLKFLLETRLQSESFDTLDHLLGFRVEKLWCKLVKIFD